MSSDSIYDAWLRFCSPTFNLPGSGSIGSFNYDPYTTWGAPTLISGSASVERVVYRDVASPGRQLGLLTDVVLELAETLKNKDGAYVESDNVKKLKTMTEKIQKIKKTVGENTEAAVREGLEKLQKADEAAFKALIKEFAAAMK